ncbi:MAG: hypothetical protein QOH32_1128 [Bradyrhizobium sp.]|jgi:hypothetical protein|nr:hypothetical protein [Bradyrhizobium sp.]
MTAPIGLAGHAMPAAGSIGGTFRTSTEKLLLKPGAGQAIAFQQRLLAFALPFDPAER